MQLVDTHTHVHFETFADRADRVLQAAATVGVTQTINVGVNLGDSKKAVEFVRDRVNTWATVGVHPHDAKDMDSSTLKALTELFKQPRIVAIGEIGLDYYKLFSSKREQKTALSQQIEAGLATKLPFVFHVREAWTDFFEIIDHYKGLRGVVHSFSAHPAQLDEILSRGLFIGLNGIMTFTEDRLQLEAAKSVPKDCLLLETDAPFLAPAGRRGHTCEPKDLVLTAQFLAELRGESLEDLAKYTTNNAKRLFKLT